MGQLAMSSTAPLKHGPPSADNATDTNVMIGIGQFRSALLHYLHIVAGGRSVRVVRRGRVVARMHSLPTPGSGVDSRSTRLLAVDLTTLRSSAGGYFDQVAVGVVVDVVHNGRRVARISRDVC